MNSTQMNLWAAFRFSTALCAITLVASLIMKFLALDSDQLMLGFLCNLPLCFYFATLTLQDTRGKVEVLESRIKQLESEQRT